MSPNHELERLMDRQVFAQRVGLYTYNVFSLFQHSRSALVDRINEHNLLSTLVNKSAISIIQLQSV